MEPLAVAAGLLIVAVSAVIQGAIGFGFPFVSAPLLVLLNPDFLPAPLIINSAILTPFIFWRERRHVDWPRLSWVTIGTVVGAVAGGLVLARLTVRGFDALFGVVLLAAVLMSLVGWRPRVNRRSATIAGATAGFMATTSAIGGPPVALLYQGADGPTLRGTLSAYFMLATPPVFAALYFAGRLGTEELKLAVLLLPGTLTGFVISRFIIGRLDRAAMRKGVLAISAIGGVILLARLIFAS